MRVTEVEEADSGTANFKHWFKTRSYPIWRREMRVSYNSIIAINILN